MKTIKVIITIAVVYSGLNTRYRVLPTIISKSSNLRHLSNEPSPIDERVGSNPFFPILHDVRRMYVKTESDVIPLLWDVPPSYVGGIQITTVIEKCFRLTSSRVTRKEGKFSTEGDVAVLSNINDIPAIFMESEIEQTPKMFAFFMHPVKRSVYLFKYLQRATKDPHYDERVTNMDLITYLKYLKQELNKNHYHHYRLGNWMVRSLVKKNRFEHLTLEDVEIATNILRKKCFVGLFDEMEKSLQNLAEYFGWELGGKQCLDEAGMGRSSLHRNIVVRGSEAWQMLSEMNKYDIALFENINSIFLEQGTMKFHKDWDQIGLQAQTIFPFLTDVRKISSHTPSKGFPILFLAPPHSSVQDVGIILDVCFDNTRAIIADNNGAAIMAFTSIQDQIKQINEGAADQENLQANIIVLSNLNHVPRFLEQRQLHTNTPYQGTGFTILQHPVNRAIHMFEYLKTAENDFYYDERIAHMDLETYLKFLLKEGNEDHFHWLRMSNWVTRSLSSSPRTKILDDVDIDTATKVLEQNFIIGFNDDMEKSLERLRIAFGWEMFDVKDCLKTSAELEKSVNSVSFIKGRSILEEMNRLDLKLYERAKLIFEEQGRYLS